MGLLDEISPLYASLQGNVHAAASLSTPCEQREKNAEAPRYLDLPRSGGIKSDLVIPGMLTSNQHVLRGPWLKFICHTTGKVEFLAKKRQKPGVDFELRPLFGWVRPPNIQSVL
jgi:hypothetical protein